MTITRRPDQRTAPWIMLAMLLIMPAMLLAQDIREPTHGVTITVPTAWEQLPTNHAMVVFSAGEPAPYGTFRANANLVIEPLPRPMDTTTYADATIQVMQAQVADFNLMSRQTHVTQGQLAIELMEYQARFGAIQVHNRLAVFTMNGNGFCLTCCSSPTDFASDQTVLNGIVDSLRIE